MHGNAPLTPEVRRRLVVRVIEDKRPIGHVAAEAGIARQTLSKWLGRYREHGEQGLADRQARRQRVGYRYFHIALDGYSRLAYAEVLPDEQGRTAAGFSTRARAFFATHGIDTIQRVVTDNA